MRFVQRGLVQRLTDPNDGRGVLVQMTEQGKTLVDVAITRLSDAEAHLLTGVPRTERERLATLLRRLALSVDRYAPDTLAPDFIDPESEADQAPDPDQAPDAS